MSKNLTKISKFLSLILRHQPETVGVELDENGWVEVSILIDAVNRWGTKLNREELEQVVRTSDKQRFAISEDGLRIRANQGHSVAVDLQLSATRPPEFLYHGTVKRFLDSIRQNGINAGSRHHVHLSADQHTAKNVGSRRGSPVLLKIYSGRMHKNEIEFFLSKNGVWLVEHVPPEFIEFPQTET